MLPSHESIVFYCHHCDAPLTVPANMAGISGPCPSCQQEIVAPHVDQPEAAADAPGEEDLTGENPPAGTPYGQQPSLEQPFASQDQAAFSPEDSGYESDPSSYPIDELAAYGDFEGYEDLPGQAAYAEYEEPYPGTDAAYPMESIQGQEGYPDDLQLEELPPDFEAFEHYESEASPLNDGFQPSGEGQPPPSALFQSPAPSAPSRLRTAHGQTGKMKAIAAVAIVAALLGATIVVVPKLKQRLSSSPTTDPTPASAEPGIAKPLALPDFDELPLLADTEYVKPPAAEQEQPEWNEPSILEPPRTFLEDFLTSPNWEDLVGKSVGGESLRPEMAAYYQKHPYQPEEVIAVSFEHKQKFPDSDYQFYLFKVATASNQRAFPMTVEETADGFRTDWVTFVEFKDMHLKQFLDNPEVGSESLPFHVILRRGFYFADEVPDVDNKASFEVTAPVDGLQSGWVFVPKYSDYSKELEETIKWGYTYFPIVELKWVADSKSPDKPYVRLEKVQQFNWRGQPPDSAAAISQAETPDS